MEYRDLGRTGLKVSALTLGTMTFGEQNTEAEGHAQMDYALEQGINMFDAAEIYPIPPKAATQGATETIVGTWLASRKKRDQVLIATKVAGRSAVIDWLRDKPALSRQTPEQMREAIDKSLKRLQTDYVDLYQLHWPDRPIRVFEGLEYRRFADDAHNIHEILDVLGAFVASGKVRFIGLSNETPWGVMKFLKLAEQHNLPRVVSVQNAYSLVNRVYEVGLSEVGYEEQVSLLGYSPLGQGYLTGKYEDGALPPGARKTLFDRLGRYEQGNGPRAISAYVALARRHGLDPAQMAIAFAKSRPFMTSVIIGATTMDQLKTDMAAADLELPEAVLEEIDKIHLDYPNPCP
ncbi:aldo/keto reductase [Methyloceanibacter methanicus]|uniref:Protein tas n=1 Tax=Methyloceanibacter methanicus TaxID=1774968 RepID=A0A1E3W6T0_9HYPH|nr:NADP(H)-dependent aldo-keto reductase [Methyloceanibacter methanicus]ODS01212.1 aldo/keto reductase [Methyloceanibacter methanicus]